MANLVYGWMDGWTKENLPSTTQPPPPPLMRWERNLNWYPRPRHPRVLCMGMPVQPMPRPRFSLAVSSSPCLSRSSCGIPHSCDRPGISIWAPATAETTPSFPLLRAGSLKEPSGKSLGKAKEPFPASNFSPPGSQGFWGGCLISRAQLALSLLGHHCRRPGSSQVASQGTGPHASSQFFSRMQQCARRDEARARNRESLGDEVPHAAPARAASSCHAGRGQVRRAGLPSWSAPGAESFSSALMGPDQQGPDCVSEGRAGVHMQLPECGCSLFLE